MLAGMNRKEASILSGLVGIALGMICSIFLEYSIAYSNIEKIIHSSCQHDSISRINLTLFGKVVTVKCTNGETITFSLIE